MSSGFSKTLLLATLALACGNALAMQSGDVQRPTLRSDIAPVADMGAQSNGKISFTLHNPGTTSLFLLRWQTPLAGISQDLFEVSLNGKPVQYVGPVYKRAEPTAADYVELKAGESRTVTVDLGGNYDMQQNGMYEVRFKNRVSEAFAERQDRAGVRIGAIDEVELAGATSFLWVNGFQASMVREEALRSSAPVEWQNNVNAAIGYVGCSSSRQSALPSALSQALSYATNASNYLNAGTHGARYTTWFGTYSSSNFNTVKSHYTNIKSALGTQNIVFDCSCTDSGTYAYVYPTQPYKIYLCGAFWSAPNSGTDSRGGTIVHETSHFSVVAGTDDLAYGQTAAKALAKKTPSKAIRNADSHEYFSENTPFQN
jgi:peptidyl-Lys metalloendopeptidase